VRTLRLAEYDSFNRRLASQKAALVALRLQSHCTMVTSGYFGLLGLAVVSTVLDVARSVFVYGSAMSWEGGRV
jgi:hypothetical protein